MTELNFSKPREMRCSWLFAEGLMYSDDAVVLLALPTEDEEVCEITYFHKELDVLPPWIIE